MPLKTDELRTQALGPMPTPAELGNAHPITDDVAERIKNSRRQIEDILTGRDKFLNKLFSGREWLFYPVDVVGFKVC